MAVFHGLSRLCFSIALLWSPAAFGKVWTIEASDRMEQDAQEALLLASPGDTVLLPAGRFKMSVELTMAVPHVTLKGQGMDKTVLEYTETAVGPQAIVAIANYSTIEDLAVVNHPGDGIKTVGIKGATIRRTKIEWTRRGDTNNGAYGLYPVLSSDVLLEDNLVIGASDAGIYVGQSHGIIVRRNRAEYNVAGIEIENSQRADVYDNYATNNTGGILVFNLPNLLVQGGHGTRVFKNTVINNNHKNFAAEGNSVALVPQGTGMLVLSNDDVEIFENLFENHNTTSIAIASYHVTENVVTDPAFDALPENVYIHSNVFRNAGRWPLIGGNKLGIVGAALSFPHRVPHIIFDGIGQSDGKGGFLAADLQGDRRICIGKNEQDGGEKSYFGDFQLWTQKWWSPIPGWIKRDMSKYNCESTRLAAVTLAQAPTPPALDPKLPSPEEISRLCETAGEGINWQALARVDCPKLSAYRLFQNAADPLQGGAAEDAIPYDLTTPLFSDYASKDRIIYLPPGKNANYKKNGTFDFPVGTVISKTFYFPEDMRRPEEDRRVIETRLLIHRERGWKGLVYLWQGDDAELTIGGATSKVSWTDDKGKAKSNDYRIPNLAQCSGCHVNNQPIGPQAGYLNRDGHGPLAGQNQLQYMASAGRLVGMPSDFTEVPRYAVWNDPETGTLAERTKAYLDINCAHCHNPGGKGNTSGLFLNHGQAEDVHYGFCKPPVAAGRGAGGILFDIVPGKPEQSILVSRMDSTKAAMKMPELAKGMVHEEGVALVRQWIKSLPGKCEEK